VDVQRYGAGLADIFTGQGDYWQATRNGGHGDYRCLVFTPNSVQESADLVALAFDKAEEYRNPVIILSDASISQMMESVEFPAMREHNPDTLEWALKGKGPGPNKRHTSVMYYRPDYDAYLKAKYDRMIANEQRWEEFQTEDAEYILVAYGISARICTEAAEMARAGGRKVGFIRPITAFPFPVKAFDKLDYRRIRALAAVEISCLSQMIEDLRLSVRGRAPVYPIRGGTRVYDSGDVLEALEGIIAGTVKESY
jgi:2-oxoglutarate ferredoxin oxidoreductase subunit alpha